MMTCRRLLANTVMALALAATTGVVTAEDQQAAGTYGPGMMGGQAGMGPGMGMMGQGMMGGGSGMGPGMGMMGMGPGMMGPGMGMMGMGPGMGMMGHGMGMGMMGGYDPFSALDLNADQQKKITQIQDALRKQHWDLMGKMQDEYVKLRDLYAADPRDPSAIGQQMQRVFDLRRQMIESGVDAENRMEAVLTAEQKSQLRNEFRRGCMMR